MIVAVVTFVLPDALSLDEARATFEASAPNYQNVHGLRRKYYILSEDGRTAGGVYLWESREQAEALYDQAWRDRLTARYGATPSVTYFASPVTVEPSAITVA